MNKKIKLNSFYGVKCNGGVKLVEDYNSLSTNSKERKKIDKANEVIKVNSIYHINEEKKKENTINFYIGLAISLESMASDEKFLKLTFDDRMAILNSINAIDNFIEILKGE